jgi:hypothetical protein
MTPLASHPALTPTYLTGTTPGMPATGHADKLASFGGRRADSTGTTRSLDELLLGTINQAGATAQQKMAAIQAVMPMPELFDDEEEDELFQIQNMLVDFNRELALQSAFARKGVGAIETLMRS